MVVSFRLQKVVVEVVKAIELQTVLEALQSSRALQASVILGSSGIVEVRSREPLQMPPTKTLTPLFVAKVKDTAESQSSSSTNNTTIGRDVLERIQNCLRYESAYEPVCMCLHLFPDEPSIQKRLRQKLKQPCACLAD